MRVEGGAYFFGRVGFYALTVALRNDFWRGGSRVRGNGCARWRYGAGEGGRIWALRLRLRSGLRQDGSALRRGFFGPTEVGPFRSGAFFGWWFVGKEGGWGAIPTHRDGTAMNGAPVHVPAHLWRL